MREKGTYALIIALASETTIAVGRLGEFTFPRGHYIYVGSAQMGLHARVRRHLRDEKRMRWHIDYLLEHAQVVEVWYTLSEEHVECQWQRAVHGMPDAKIPVHGFGSSDCRCSSHLTYFPSSPSFELFQKGLGKNGLTVERASTVSFL